MGNKQFVQLLVKKSLFMKKNVWSIKCIKENKFLANAVSGE